MAILENISLAPYSAFGTGGSCRYFWQPESIEELASELPRFSNVPFYLLGAGSNSLLSDTPWPGMVLQFGKLAACEEIESGFVCGAGALNTYLAERARDRGLAGAAWMYRLPGQLGATIRMNARCYGSEISQCVDQVITVTHLGEIKTYDVTEASRIKVFPGYKDTMFMHNKEIVVQGRIRLAPGPLAPMVALMDKIEKDRISKGHFDFPTCGCVFKNEYAPEVSISSGLLLELAGSKSLHKTGSRVSEKHANFIFNYNGASSQEILELSLEMREQVWQEFGVWLAYEMELLGEFPAALLQRFHEQRPPSYRSDRLAEARAQFQIKIAGG